MHIPTLIARKREGHELTPQQVTRLIEGYTHGHVPDYQMSAFAMAVFFKGMTPVEIAALTRAMMESGDCFSYPTGHPPVVDKHSTGGIGDKVSLILAPLVACTGCWVPMVSGRGLGITGGTLDKLESIPGFNVHLGLDEAVKQLQQIGVVMMGQTDRFCPADKKLYALRDVTGTVPSIALITASIMSKKLAESLDRLVLDVKYGSGAFMQTKKDAEALAASMIAVGKEMGVEVSAVLNPMHEPLGRAVGNSLEVIESLETLEGGGPADLREIVLDLAGEIAGNRRGVPGRVGEPPGRRQRPPPFQPTRRRPRGKSRGSAPSGRNPPSPCHPRRHRLRRRGGFPGGRRSRRPGSTPAWGRPGKGQRPGGFRGRLRSDRENRRADPRRAGGLPDPRPHRGGFRHGGGDVRKSRENLHALIDFPCCQTRGERFRFRPPQAARPLRKAS